MRVTQLETPAEGCDLEHLSQLHHEEYGGSREYDVEAIARACAKCSLDKERRFVNGWIVYDEKGLPVGYLAATIADSFYSFRTYAIQEMWYVIPRVRGTRASLMLLDAFEGWARDRGCERIYTQVEHDSDTKLTDTILSLMMRLGYRKQGYIAVKVLNNEDRDDDRTAHRAMGAEQAQH